MIDEITTKRLVEYLVADWNHQSVKSILRKMRNRGFKVFHVFTGSEVVSVETDAEALKAIFPGPFPEKAYVYFRGEGVGYMKFDFAFENKGQPLVRYNGSEEFVQAVKSIKE